MSSDVLAHATRCSCLPCSRAHSLETGRCDGHLLSCPSIDSTHVSSISDAFPGLPHQHTFAQFYLGNYWGWCNHTFQNMVSCPCGWRYSQWCPHSFASKIQRTGHHLSFEVGWPHGFLATFFWIGRIHRHPKVATDRWDLLESSKFAISFFEQFGGYEPKCAMNSSPRPARSSYHLHVLSQQAPVFSGSPSLSCCSSIQMCLVWCLYLALGQSSFQQPSISRPCLFLWARTLEANISARTNLRRCSLSMYIWILSCTGMLCIASHLILSCSQEACEGLLGLRSGRVRLIHQCWSTLPPSYCIQ